MQIKAEFHFFVYELHENEKDFKPIVLRCLERELS